MRELEHSWFGLAGSDSRHRMRASYEKADNSDHRQSDSPSDDNQLDRGNEAHHAQIISGQTRGRFASERAYFGRKRSLSRCAQRPTCNLQVKKSVKNVKACEDAACVFLVIISSLCVRSELQQKEDKMKEEEKKMQDYI